MEDIADVLTVQGSFTWQLGHDQILQPRLSLQVLKEVVLPSSQGAKLEDKSLCKEIEEMFKRLAS